MHRASPARRQPPPRAPRAPPATRQVRRVEADTRPPRSTRRNRCTSVDAPERAAHHRRMFDGSLRRILLPTAATPSALIPAPAHALTPPAALARRPLAAPTVPLGLRPRRTLRVVPDPRGEHLAAPALTPARLSHSRVRTPRRLPILLPHPHAPHRAARCVLPSPPPIPHDGLELDPALPTAARLQDHARSRRRHASDVRDDDGWQQRGVPLGLLAQDPHDAPEREKREHHGVTARIC